MYCAYCGKPVVNLTTACPSCGEIAGGPLIRGIPKSNKALTVTIVGLALLVPLLIVLIIAAIAIPNLLNAIDRGKTKRTMADMRVIARGLDGLAVRDQRYPAVDTMEDLQDLLEPEFVPTMPLVDAWEHPLTYSCWKSDESLETCDNYTLIAPGKDGRIWFPDPRMYARYAGDAALPGDDIVVVNGEFVMVPSAETGR